MLSHGVNPSKVKVKLTIPSTKVFEQLELPDIFSIFQIVVPHVAQIGDVIFLIFIFSFAADSLVLADCFAYSIGMVDARNLYKLVLALRGSCSKLDLAGNVDIFSQSYFGVNHNIY